MICLVNIGPFHHTKARSSDHPWTQKVLMRRIHHLGHYCKEFSQIIEAYFLTECVQSLRNNWTVTFVAYCEELRFQHTCQYLHSGEVEEYVEAVIGGCVEKGPHVLKYLFQLRNA